jgi:putative hydrolase of the HAD superfamily
MSVAAILFDLDDTLLDRDATVAHYLEGQRARLGAPDAEIAGEEYRRCFVRLDEMSIDDRHAIFARLAARHRLPASIDELAEDFRRHAWSRCHPFPDAIEALRELRARSYRLGVITNGPEEIQRRKIEALGLPALVDAILISGREGLRKPDPGIFHRAATRLGVESGRCLFVGDNPETDVAGAHAAGMSSAWRRGYFAWPDDLSVRPTYSIDGIGELLAIQL